jgi:16S rRNA (uracil1498-N3)-methyltransferase
MRLRRVFVAQPLTTGGTLTLSGSAAHHLLRVLRLRTGDDLTVFNGAGGEFAARIAGIHGDRVALTLGAHTPSERESPLAITLAQGISRADRMDLVLQKATELGVARIVPLLSERSVVRLAPPQAQRKLTHWQAITVAACEQSGRNRLPQVCAPQPLAQFLAAERAADAAAHARVLLAPAAARTCAELGPLHAVSVLIGPEGGLTPAEIEDAVAAGFIAVRMGPRVLRTETAALVALALLQHQAGDL